MKTNKNNLVIQSVQGSIHHPTMSGTGYWVGYDGYGRISYGVGGITYNYKIGDSCMNIEGDHVEPGVSLRNPVSNENTALQSLACVGNTARVISGDAKGRTGYVTGKHGGIDHLILYFDEETLDLMTCDDRILIKAHGQGLKLLDYPEICVMNLDPSLLDKMNIKEVDGGIEVNVTTRIPAHLMGSGLGTTTLMSGDYDIMTQDKDANMQYGIDQLKFGDIICIENHFCQNGPHYLEGSCSIGVIVHSDSNTSGHGPGVCVLMTCKNNTLKTVIDKDANLANYLTL